MNKSYKNPVHLHELHWHRHEYKKNLSLLFRLENAGENILQHRKKTVFQSFSCFFKAEMDSLSVKG